MNQIRLAIALAAAVLLSACGRTIPLTYQVREAAACDITVTDGRLKQGGMEIRLDLPTAFIGTPEFFPVDLVPTISEIVRSEVCTSQVVLERPLSIEIGKLTCDAKLGFTKAVARLELQLLVRQARGPLTPVTLTNRAEIDADVSGGAICDKAINTVAAQIATEIAAVQSRK